MISYYQMSRNELIETLLHKDEEIEILIEDSKVDDEIIKSLENDLDNLRDIIYENL